MDLDRLLLFPGGILGLFNGQTWAPAIRLVLGDHKGPVKLCLVAEEAICSVGNSIASPLTDQGLRAACLEGELLGFAEMTLEQMRREQLLE